MTNEEIVVPAGPARPADDEILMHENSIEEAGEMELIGDKVTCRRLTVAPYLSPFLLILSASDTIQLLGLSRFSSFAFCKQSFACSSLSSRHCSSVK